MNYEVIVIGCGPAGLSAAIYLGRAKVKTLVVGKSKQSQLALAHTIENYFGFPEGIKGKVLLEKGIKQAKKFHVQIIEQEAVAASSVKNGFKIKLANGKSFTTQILIFATGTPIRMSGIEHEQDFMGKGIQYCVECDGPLFKDKKVAVIGCGNHAAETALELCTFTRNVSILSNADEHACTFSPEMIRAIDKKKIPILNELVTSFTGDTFCKGVILTNGKKMNFDGIFMACGTASALDFAAELGLLIEQNILKTDTDNKTNIESIFAAGNCCGRCRQVAKNVGDGCNAALNAIKHLRNQQWYSDYSGGK